VKLDQNADRIANYRIWHLPKDGDAYVDFVDVEMIDSTNGVAIIYQSINQSITSLARMLGSCVNVQFLGFFMFTVSVYYVCVLWA